MRHDIIHFLDYVYERNVGIDYREKFREYWAPKGPAYGLSRCMPWGALTLNKVTKICGEEMYDTVFADVFLVKDKDRRRYVKTGKLYYTFAYEFDELGEEYDTRIYNALLCVMFNGAFKYKGGTS